MNGPNAHNLAIEEVLADHDRIDRRGVLEGQEREAPRTARGVPHDSAGFDLAKLCEVLPQRFCDNAGSVLRSTGEQTLRCMYHPSCPS